MQALSSCIVREDLEPMVPPRGDLGAFGSNVLAIFDALNTPNHPLIDGAAIFSTPHLQGSLLNAQQQDAHELCQALLSTLASSRRKVILGLSIEVPLPKGVHLSGTYPPPSFALPPPSLLLPWEGLQASTVTCMSCGRGSTSAMQVTPFSTLTLPSMSEPAGSSIEEAFEECMASTTIDDYACDYCKTRVTCVKQVAIVRWPQLLLLHIDRLTVLGNFGVGKSEAHISFPQRMFAFCQGGHKRDGLASPLGAIPLPPTRPPYELAAVVEHHGGSRSGHYTAFKRVVEEGQRCRWLLCSDASVRPVTLERVLEAKAYLIFYRRAAVAAHCPAGQSLGRAARQ